MSAPVRIEGKVWGDARYELLATIAAAGYDRYSAIARMAQLWSWCTDRQSAVVTEAIVCAHLGPNGVAAILGSELGERTPDGIRVRGTLGRIEWKADFNESKVRAGKARAESSSRDQQGRMVAKARPARRQQKPSRDQQTSSTTPADVQQTTSTTPAESSALTLTLTLKEEDATDKSAAPASPKTPSPIQQVTAAFFELYERDNGCKPGWDATEAKKVKNLLAKAGEGGATEVIRRMRILFDHPPDWLDPPFGIGTLLAHYNALGSPSAPRTANRVQPDRPAPALPRL